jgi:hypothetical protein
MLDAVRDTLTLIVAARPVQHDVMFPDYHDSKRLCGVMAASLSKWDDHNVVETAIRAFQCGDARVGMQLAHERVHFYVPNECKWAYP